MTDSDVREPPHADLSDSHTEQPSLNGRKVLITGGTTGIGRAVAVLLASEGAKIFICGRGRQNLADALQHVRDVGAGEGISIDLAERENIERLFEAANDYFGTLDIAIINAAVPAEDLAGTSDDDLYYRTAVDFTAYLATAKAAIGRMSAGSDIIFIGSMSGVSREAGASVYVAAKAGIEGFADSLREELAGRDIKVGLIEPGLTGTDLHGPGCHPEEQRDLIHAQQMLRAEDIAASVHFMLTQPRRTAVSLMRVEPRLKQA
jgi:3-oxoacyl-[acyl-carrier protein] reductase